MRKFKKTLAMTAAALISFSSICSGIIQPIVGNVNIVSAAYKTDYLEYGDELFYRKVDSDEDGTYDYAEISDCDRYATNVTIPSEIDGLPVSSIAGMGSGVFLISVTIPDSVTSIGEYAFNNCIRLTSITIPGSVTSIGEGALNDCSSLENINVSENNNNYISIDNVLFNKEKTELIRYPAGKPESEYVIPDSVTSIKSRAFSYSSNLTSITIPDSVTLIDQWAFKDCTGLKSVSIPGSITSIEDFTFVGCSGLTDITIPDSVTSIKQWAFDRCTGLTDIIIPDSVTLLSYGVFSGCTGLTSITIPDGITSIQGAAFSDCTGLTSIIIPDNVTSIGDSAFRGCTNLTNITIPDNVPAIERLTFYECPSLENINVSENNNNLSSVDGVLFNKEKTELIRYPAGNSKSEYTIPNSVMSIKEYAFSGCEHLTSLTIPDSVKSMENAAFEKCTDLTSVTLLDGIPSIGANAFYRCPSLTDVTIPDSVTSIDSGAFSDCSSLTKITIPDGITLITYGMFSNCSSLTDITIPDSVTSIEEHAFRECTGLTDITIPDSVKSIEAGAFRSCASLTSITIKNPECDIFNYGSTISNDDDGFEHYSYKGIICGYENSTAQAYANTYGYEFKSLGKSSFLPGDISVNGKIDLFDAIEIAKYMAGKRQFTNEEMKIADFNNDGKVNLHDAIGIAKYMMNSSYADKKTVSTDLTIGMKSQSVTGAEADEEFILGQTQFALNLFKNTVSDEENTFISPYSVMQALAMTANGADKNTKAEMEKVLGGMPIEKLNEYLYTQRIGQPNDEKCKLSTANSIWYKNDPKLLTVLPEFLQRNADYYNASAYSSPFNNATVNDINKWVNEKTDEMIPHLLDSIPANARMYLINAVAFDAKWEEQYSGYDVYDNAHFNAFDGSSQKVRMMSSTESDYLEDENATGFYKYYQGRRYAFAALLPKEGMTVSEYINTLTPESLNNTLSNSQEKIVHAAMPKFSYDYDVKLNDTLSDMGMPNAFNELKADFTKMIKSKENIYIDSVLHKTHIDVTEEGTKAAAVTAVSAVGNAAPSDEIKYVTLDRPFVYCIVDTQTSLPVFIGAVNSVE